MRIAQLANFYSPTSGGLRTAMDALGDGYVAAGHDRVLIVPGPVDSVRETDHGTVVALRSPSIGGNDYRLVIAPQRLFTVLDRFAPTSVEVSDKSTMLVAAVWAHRRRVRRVLFSHERLDTHLAPRIGRPAGLRVAADVVNRTLLRGRRAAWRTRCSGYSPGRNRSGAPPPGGGPSSTPGDARSRRCSPSTPPPPASERPFLCAYNRMTDADDIVDW